MGGFGRNEAADLRHQTDQRHLTHIGGLARHVGAGDDGQQVAAAVHVGVIGDEHIPLEHPFHHRMPTV